MSLVPNFDSGNNVAGTFKAVGSFYSTQDQSMTGGPAVPILFDTQTSGVTPVDMSLNPSTGEITFNRTGLYKVCVDIRFLIIGGPAPLGLSCWISLNSTPQPATHRVHNITDNPPTSASHEWYVSVSIGDILTVDIGSSSGPPNITTNFTSFPPPIPDAPSATINILQID